MKDHLYFLDSNAYVYTAARSGFPATVRPNAVLLFSVDGAPITLRTAQRDFVGAAIAVAPRTERMLRTTGAGLVSVNLPPSSAFFPAFSGLAGTGVQVLDRKAFRSFDGLLSDACAGTAQPTLARQAFQEVVSVAVEQLPRAQRLDPRVAEVLHYLDAHADASLADVAKAFRLSPHRISHLISDSLGLSFRAYQSWRKQVRVCKLLYSGQSLTRIAHEAGLTDSAHLSRFYQHWYGQSPSYSRDRATVRFFS